MEGKEEIKKVEIEKLKKITLILGIIIIAIILLDQASKILMLKGQNSEIIPNILELKIEENKKGTYGVGSDSTFSYVLTNLVVIAIIGKFMTSQNQFVDAKTKILLSFIVAGGMSNVIDRLVKGYVVEFIHVNHLPVFNIADLFILIGWVSMVAIFAKFTIKEIQNRNQNKTKKNEGEN